MSSPAWLALIPVMGVISAALIAGLFALSGKRSDQQLATLHGAEEARKELIEDYRERIKLLTVDRDEARAERDVLRAQVASLEKIMSDHGWPTRGMGDPERPADRMRRERDRPAGPTRRGGA